MEKENVKILYAFSKMVTVRTLPNKSENRKKANKKKKIFRHCQMPLRA